MINLSLTQQELDYVINGVAEEIIMLEPAINFFSKAHFWENPKVNFQEIEQVVDVFNDWVMQHKLMIRLWLLDEDKEQAKKAIAQCMSAIRLGKQIIAKLESLKTH